MYIQCAPSLLFASAFQQFALFKTSHMVNYRGSAMQPQSSKPLQVQQEMLGFVVSFYAVAFLSSVVEETSELASRSQRTHRGKVSQSAVNEMHKN